MAKTEYITKQGTVAAYYPGDMSREEAESYISDELAKNLPYRLVKIDINYHADGDIIIRPQYDTISRIRRITGYLSKLDNFNDAKKAEAKARVSHIKKE